MRRERRNGSAEPEYASMGDRLRQARQARGLSLRGLAEVLGVSPSLISQVETGRAKPSVNTLYALATELRISLDVLLFMDTEPPLRSEDAVGLEDTIERPLPRDPVQRAASRSSIRLGSGVVWERLTTESIRNVDFLHVTYEVGGESSPADAFQRHSGQEWGYVLSGTLPATRLPRPFGMYWGAGRRTSRSAERPEVSDWRPFNGAAAACKLT